MSDGMRGLCCITCGAALPPPTPVPVYLSPVDRMHSFPHRECAACLNHDRSSADRTDSAPSDAIPPTSGT